MDSMTYDAEGAESPRALRASIGRTRERMTREIDTLEEKLTPANLAAHLTASAKDAATEKMKDLTAMAGERSESVMRDTKDAATGLVDEVREHAVPAAMIGIGAAWWLLSRSRSSDGYAGRDGRTLGRYVTYDESMPHTATPPRSEGLSDKAEQAGAAVSSAAGHAASQAQAYARDTRESVRRASRRTQDRWQQVLRDNPVAVGAGALLAGAAIGLLVPESERENEWMGELRDDTVDRAKELARNAGSVVQDVARDAAGDVINKVVGSND